MYYSDNCYVKNLLADKSTFGVGVAYLTHAADDDEQVQAKVAFVIMVATPSSSEITKLLNAHKIKLSDLNIKLVSIISRVTR